MRNVWMAGTFVMSELNPTSQYRLSVAENKDQDQR